MARVTVEDCIDKVENRFDLVLLASHRARMVSSGAPITIERDNDKNPVVALREIADETISPGDLREDLIHSLQKYVEVDEPEPELGAAHRRGWRQCRCRRYRGDGRPDDRGRAAQGPRGPGASRGEAGARDRAGRRRPLGLPNSLNLTARHVRAVCFWANLTQTRCRNGNIPWYCRPQAAAHAARRPRELHGPRAD